MALPRYVVLKSNSNNKYLSYIQDESQVHGNLKFSGDDVISPYTKMKVEIAKTGNGLVHLRCCYNNRYWTRKSGDEYWIVGSADEPDEDKSKWSCTLFKPEFGNDNIVHFMHVQLGKYVRSSTGIGPFMSCLFAGSNSCDDETSCTFVEWESLVILPKYVGFKGSNDSYIREEGNNLLFKGKDIGDPAVGNEMVPNHDGSICIKSNTVGKFWINEPRQKVLPIGFILTGPQEKLGQPDVSFLTFWPVRVDSNVIALKNMGTNTFCCADDNNATLMSGFTTIAKSAQFRVEELVISRDVYNVNFRLSDARIYSKNVLVMASESATNKTQEPNQAQIKLSYTDKKSSTWKTSVSLKLGVKTSIQTSVPFIAVGKIEISAEFSYSHEWGETKEESSTLENVYTVTVPPMSRVTVSMIATRGSCDVPFSYTQRDTLTDGKQVTHIMDIGIYTGINSFDFRYETKQDRL